MASRAPCFQLREVEHDERTSKSVAFFCVRRASVSERGVASRDGGAAARLRAPLKETELAAARLGGRT